jgi:succinate-semialdehyde dehydrogenase/glutarate-semialdehyde dehydrogenase
MKSFVSINPYSEEVIASHHPATTEEIEYVIQQAYVAQKEWKKTPVKHRNELLLALGKEITNQCDQLAKLASDEMGKLYHEANTLHLLCFSHRAVFNTTGNAA